MPKTVLPIALVAAATVSLAPAAVADDTAVPAPAPTAAKQLVQVPLSPLSGPPKRIKKRGLTMIAGPNHTTNAGQPISTEVRTLLRRVASLNEVDYYRVIRGPQGEVYVRTFGHRLRLVVLQSAPATGEYRAYAKRTVYIHGKRRP